MTYMPRGNRAAGNWTQYSADGTPKLNGDATVFEDVNYAPVQLFRTAGANPGIVTVPGTGLDVAGFDPGTEEEIGSGFEIPHGVLLGSVIAFHVHWGPVDATAGDVRWGLEYAFWEEDTNPVTASTTIYVTDAASGVAFQRQTAAFPDIVPPVDALGLQFGWRFFRDATDAADTYANDAVILVTIGAHCEWNMLGSSEALVK